MNIIITGNDGFIGSHLSDFYKLKNDDVYGWGRKGIYAFSGFIMSNSLNDYVEVIDALKIIRPSVIIHCAGNANVGNSVKNPFDDLVSNYVTTHNLLFALKELPLENCRFVLLSSAAVYGNPTNLPIEEHALLNPLSPYALHKESAEEVCLFMKHNYGIDTKIARIFSAYGPGLRKQIFWDMYHKINENNELTLWGTGNESRDYIYIDDLVNAIDLIATKAPQIETIYNIANGVEITIKYAAECFASHMRLKSGGIVFNGVIREGEPLNWKADISKLKLLGYKRTVSFEKGIEQYIEWIRTIKE